LKNTSAASSPYVVLSMIELESKRRNERLTAR